MADAILARAQKSPGWNELDSRMKERLLALFRASGGRVWLGGGSRSTKAQEAMFRSRYRPDPNGTISWNGQKWKHVSGAAAAPPGRSMHEVGLAADLEGDLKWMNAHAAEFGLKHFASVNNEPWHVQPVELPNSRSQFIAKMGGVWPGGSSGGPPVFPSTTSYDPSDPLGWKQIRASLDAQQQGVTAMSDDWTAIKKWQDQNEATFNAYLKTLPADQQEQIIGELDQPRDLAGVSDYLAAAPQGVKDYINYLSQLPEQAQLEAKSRLGVQSGAAAAPSAAPDAAGSAEMTSVLQTLGVSYPNAPQPTPALLAFLRGVGLNLSTAEDVKNRALERIGAATSDAMADIDRTAGRTKQNVTADLIRRNVVSSGESNTRYARHAEDVANQQGDVTRTSTSATEDVTTSYRQAQDLARQQALDRVISAEQDQATAAATSKAQEDAFRRQQDIADLAWERQQTAQQESIKQQEEALAKYAAQGVAV